MKTCHADRQGGVSLIEQMLLLCIVSLALGVALPNFRSMVERVSLEGAAGQLESELQYTKSLAIELNRTVRFTFEPTAQGMCYVIHTGGSKACRCAGLPTPACIANVKVFRFANHDAASRITTQSNSKSLAFDPTHGTVTPTATIELRNRRGDALRLVVNIMGRIRSCSSAGQIPGLPAC